MSRTAPPTRETGGDLLPQTHPSCSRTRSVSLGDYLADRTGLGFGGGALLDGGVMVTRLLAYKLTTISKVARFLGPPTPTGDWPATSDDERVLPQTHATRMTDGTAIRPGTIDRALASGSSRCVRVSIDLAAGSTRARAGPSRRRFGG